MTKPLKILYHIPYPSATGADRWIYEGWRDAFLDLGHQFDEFTAFDSLEQKVKQSMPDIFMTAVNIIDFPKHADLLATMRRNGTKVFMWMHWPLISVCKEAGPFILEDDLVDVYFGEREKEGMADFEERVGKKYFVIPNAANKRLHYPTSPVEKYQYDIVYLGAKLPMKQWFIDNVLLPLSKKYKVGIFGPYWTVKDNMLRALNKLCRYAHFESGVKFCNERRIVIPPDHENQLYSSAKIALNFHEREASTIQSHIIVNQRAFKIPACGGFQICDAVPAIRQYFSEDELVTVNVQKQEWHDAVEYYLNNDKEREAIRLKGAQRAAAEHSYHCRVAQLLKLYQEG